MGGNGRSTGAGSDVVVRLVDIFHDVVRSSLHRLQPIVLEHGITVGQFLALHVVSSMAVASMSDVADRLGVSAPAVSVTVDQLEEAGLVRRRRAERDARRVELVVTARGRALETRVWGRVRREMAGAVRGLPPSDLATAVRVFEEIARRAGPGPVAHPQGSR
jgi:DNA-binding MarR family transcriptional regulator